MKVDRSENMTDTWERKEKWPGMQGGRWEGLARCINEFLSDENVFDFKAYFPIQVFIFTFVSLSLHKSSQVRSIDSKIKTQP